MNQRSNECRWEERCCGDGSTVRDECYALGACGCKVMPHPAHYRSFDGRKHPADR